MPNMARAYYSSSLSNFLIETKDSIIGKITQNHPQQLEHLQTGAWKGQISILQNQLQKILNTDPNSYIHFEFLVPRMGKRADVVLIHKGLIFVIEFKVGAETFNSADIQQAHGYALDLKNFHEGSHNKKIIPILVSTESKARPQSLEFAADFVAQPILCSSDNLIDVINSTCKSLNEHSFDPMQWVNTGYKPTPSIVEAAQALYANHAVEDISRSDAGAKNISKTSLALLDVIHQARLTKQKAICFVTGVPGAGKTLVGLNIATQNSNPKDDEYAVFLSGNGPLVDVLREALARDRSSKEDGLTKASSYRDASQFIQNIHHFRDDALRSSDAPVENVVIFDEAQRAWDKDQACKFMKKRGELDFNQSEPEFLIDTMDRHKDWCVVIALIGGGQEIHDGEAGIKEWLDSIERKFNHWNVYYSAELTTQKYVAEGVRPELKNVKTLQRNDLHLSISMRSFRSEHLSEMVHHLIAGNSDLACQIYNKFSDLFPIKITRNLHTAKNWIKHSSRANETKGLIASSGGIRLKAEGVFVKNRFTAKEWFLNPDTDVRSCHYLEDVATEFDIQGLELDWCLIGWDADYRYGENGFEYWQFVGSKWQRRNLDVKQRYLENAYRVLLTRARQGMVIYIPKGDDLDPTRPKSFYDGTYGFLRQCGMTELD